MVAEGLFLLPSAVKEEERGGLYQGMRLRPRVCNIIIQNIKLKCSEAPRTGRPVCQTGHIYVRLSNVRLSDVRFIN